MRASRRTYDVADHAATHQVLSGNNGNVKRTARETGIPENTVRRWRDEWEKNGPPMYDPLAVLDYRRQRRDDVELALGHDVLAYVLKVARDDELQTAHTDGLIGRYVAKRVTRLLAEGVR